MKNKILVFFIIGFVLYLIDIGLNNYDDKEIFISDSEITSLITAWRSQVGRNPNDDEVARIINDLVQEEILYREALKLGLDQDDRIIKRRLAQKLSFLKQESVEKLPSSQELKDFFNDNKEKYYIEPEYTFTHYFFSSENNSFDRSNKAIKNIYVNKQINADPFLLGKNFVDVNLTKIKNDLIKLLLNLNIVVSPDEKDKINNNDKKEMADFKKVGRNEKCPCGSGKKFKHCHGNL